MKAGAAFLPQTVGTVVAASVGSNFLSQRFSNRALLPAGTLLAAVGMVLLSRISTSSKYASTVLPAVVLIGAGRGLALANAFNVGVSGVDPEDAGAASATVNAMQQIGASIGPSLFNTIAGSVTAAYLRRHAKATDIATVSTVHGYVVSFWIAAAIFVAATFAGALIVPLRADDAETIVSESPVAPKATTVS